MAPRNELGGVLDSGGSRLQEDIARENAARLADMGTAEVHHRLTPTPANAGLFFPYQT